MSFAEHMLQNLYSAPILVVDDDHVCRAFISRALALKGFTQVLCADSGISALALMERARPDLILLDIMMSGLNGLDCCARIRSMPEFRDIPILMLTGLADEALRVQSFRAGASDFISKPPRPEELLARVEVHLQRRLMLKALLQYKERLDSELESARALQTSILPTVAELEQACKRYGANVAAHVSPSSELGGDFWGMKTLSSNEIALWTVDFSGHGVAAALNAFRVQAYLNEHSPGSATPGEQLAHLNDKLLRLLMRGHFATIFYGHIHMEAGYLDYACACSPHPFVLRAGGGVEALDGNGLPLGIQHGSYPTRRTAFAPGDTLVLYSDALTETRGENGGFIDEENLAMLLSGYCGAPPATIRDALLSHLTAHSPHPPGDDLTLCVFQKEA